MNTEVINWKHYRALLRTTFLIETRGRTAKKPYRRTLSLFISYGFASLYLAWHLSETFYEPAYVLIAFTVSMYLAAFTVITSYSFIILDTADEVILQQFPISQKTLFAVRSTNLFLYIFLISIPFYIPLLFFFTLHTIAPATVIFLFIVLFLASLWTTCLFLILYNIIVQLFSGSTQIFSFLQIVFILLLLFFYQSLPTFDAGRIDWQKMLMGSFQFYFPPIWFASLFWSMQGYIVTQSQNITLLMGSVSLIILMLLLRSPLLLLPKIHPAVKSQNDISILQNDLFYRVMTFMRPKNIYKKAGYDLLRSMFFRDRILQIHVLPALLMPLAVSLYGIMTKQLYSPMNGQILYPSSLMHITVATFFLFAGRNIIQTITHTRFADARWLLQLCDSNTLERYSKGIYDSILWNIFFPLSVIQFFIFWIFMPLQVAVLQALFLFLIVKFQTATWSVFQSHVPFSMHEDRLSSARRLIQFFWVIPYIVILLLFHHLASMTVYSFIIFLLALDVSSRFCFRYLHRKSYSIEVD